MLHNAKVHSLHLFTGREPRYSVSSGLACLQLPSGQHHRQPAPERSGLGLTPARTQVNYIFTVADTQTSKAI